MDFDNFLSAYLECALWSSVGPDDEPLDATYGIDDVSDELHASSTEVCQDFFDSNQALLQLAIKNCKYTMAQAGHDFWLTRNRHGAGFWDRGLGAVGQRLTEATHIYGGVDLYVGDDDKIHG
jgi:hypothetical protein